MNFTDAQKETAASLHADQFKDIKLLHSLNGRCYRSFLEIFFYLFKTAADENEPQQQFGMADADVEPSWAFRKTTLANCFLH